MVKLGKLGRFRGRTIVLLVGSCCVLFLVSRGYYTLVDSNDTNKPLPETINVPPRGEQDRSNYVRADNPDMLIKFAKHGLADGNSNLDHVPLFGVGRAAPARNSRKDGKSEIALNSYPNLLKGKFIPPRSIVHFDLKGAALKVAYFDPVFKLIKELNGTGVLLEWEDMFPYEGQLAVTKHGNAYTKDEIRSILRSAQSHGLTVIPLVQTFGHLEWILKHPQFAKFRQQEKYAQVICLADDEAVSMVKDAVRQVLSIHKEFGIEYFHMGADEAFQVGMCQKDQDLMRTKLENSRERLMLRHIVSIASYATSTFDVKVLMWHDMLNNVDSAMMKEFELGKVVEPVVWAYAENLQSYLYPDMWQRFSETFPHIWGASAFKGADGPSRYYSNIPHYLLNHQSWTQQMTDYYKPFTQFRGLILTGWQRFDHFAVLCETFPVGIPSLAINLVAINSGEFNRGVVATASRILQCSSNLDIESAGIAAFCKFPGAGVYQQVQQLRMTLTNIENELYNDFQVQGWMSRFNRVHNYSSAWYLDQIVDKVTMFYSDLDGIQKNLRVEMQPIFFPDTIDEFMYEYVEPDLDKMNSMKDAAKRINNIKTFPRRPFPILGSTGKGKAGSRRMKKIVKSNNLAY